MQSIYYDYERGVDVDFRKLYRSNRDRKLAGICGGLGDYLNLDPTVVRVIFVVLGLFSIGILLYVVLWLIVPEYPES